MNLDGGGSLEDVRPRIDACVAEWRDALDKMEHTGVVDAAFLQALADTGVFRARFAAGAPGLPVSIALAEVLSPINMGAALAATIHAEVFVNAIGKYGRSADVAALLSDALDARAIGCVALTEPGGGSDLRDLQTEAWPIDGDAGGWRLVGDKRYISNAACATHALVLAAARIGERRAATLFVVDLSAAGVERVTAYPKLGTLSADATHLRFDTEVPATAVIGPVGGGYACMARCLRFERVVIAAGVLAAARYALRFAVAFMRRRRQFGTPLFEMQALRHRAAVCSADLEACGKQLDAVAADVAAGGSSDVEIAALKLNCARTAGRVIDEAMQMLGGRGYTAHFPLERLWRDARLARIGGGTDEVMLEIIAAGLDRGDPTMEAELDACTSVDGPL